MAQKLQRVSTAPVTVPADETYLTTKQVAERLGVAVQTLHLWRNKDTGPLSVRFGSTVRYPLSEFEAWRAAQHQATARGEKVSA